MTLVVTSSGHLTETGLPREFEALTAGTLLEGARLRFRWQVVCYRCSNYLRNFRSVEHFERPSFHSVRFRR
jgi:Zn finger protein HypA/HybF involved in hydrogenase expression